MDFKLRFFWPPSSSSPLWDITSFNPHDPSRIGIVYLHFYVSGDDLRQIISQGKIDWWTGLLAVDNTFEIYS